MVRGALNRLRKSMTAAVRPDAHITYSQCGEDMIIAFLFAIKKVYRPSYLDIGAHHPYRLSNTALFYARGSRGINVEANPSLCALFDAHRPHDKNLNVGVGAEEGELDFYVMQDSSLSTFSDEEAKKLQNFGQKLHERRKVKIRTVQQLLDEHNNGVFPDLLSIDIEGKDFEVLRTIDYGRAPPKVICVEAAEYQPEGFCTRRRELVDFLIEQSYTEYANTNLNAIMVHKDFTR